MEVGPPTVDHAVGPKSPDEIVSSTYRGERVERGKISSLSHHAQQSTEPSERTPQALR